MTRPLRFLPASLVVGLCSLTFATSLVIIPSCLYTSIPVARVVRPNTTVTDVGGGLALSPSTVGFPVTGAGWAYQGLALGSNFEIGTTISMAASSGGSLFSIGFPLKWDPVPDDKPLHFIPYISPSLNWTGQSSYSFYGSGVMSGINTGFSFVASPADWIDIFGSFELLPTDLSFGFRAKVAPGLQLGLSSAIFPSGPSSMFSVFLGGSMVWPTKAPEASAK